MGLMDSVFGDGGAKEAARANAAQQRWAMQKQEKFFGIQRGLTEDAYAGMMEGITGAYKGQRSDLLANVGSEDRSGGLFLSAMRASYRDQAAAYGAGTAAKQSALSGIYQGASIPMIQTNPAGPSGFAQLAGTALGAWAGSPT